MSPYNLFIQLTYICIIDNQMMMEQAIKINWHKILRLDNHLLGILSHLL